MYCLHYLPHYAGTSSVFAALLLRRLLRQQAGLPAGGGKGEDESVEAGGGGHGGGAVTAGREEVGGPRLAQLRLVGTLAHEVGPLTGLGRWIKGPLLQHNRAAQLMSP